MQCRPISIVAGAVLFEPTSDSVHFDRDCHIHPRLQLCLVYNINSSFPCNAPKYVLSFGEKLIMFKNSWKIAWRNLVKDGRFTLLNLAGLSVGLTAVFLIFLWINHETSMDNFQDGGLYLVMQNVPSGDKTLLTFETTPDLLANALKAEVPGIADAGIVKLPSDDEETAVISDGKQNSLKATEAFASSNFFKLFKFKMLQGDAVRALSGSKDVLLSASLAEKLFHSASNAMGKTVTFYKGLHKKVNGPYLVSGIFAAPPANSSLQFDVLFSNQVFVNTTTQDINLEQQCTSGTYITTENGVTADQINR